MRNYSKNFKYLSYKSKNIPLQPNTGDDTYRIKLRLIISCALTVHPGEDLKLCCLLFTHESTYILTYPVLHIKLWQFPCQYSMLEESFLNLSFGFPVEEPKEIM